MQNDSIDCMLFWMSDDNIIVIIISHHFMSVLFFQSALIWVMHKLTNRNLVVIETFTSNVDWSNTDWCCSAYKSNRDWLTEGMCCFAKIEINLGRKRKIYCITVFNGICMKWKCRKIMKVSNKQLNFSNLLVVEKVIHQISTQRQRHLLLYLLLCGLSTPWITNYHL